jgi:uncharacterized protein YggU (UPF0235/DUF167 family)
VTSLRLTIRVTPRAARPGVGGRHGDALVVRVAEPAVDGRATEAALQALRRALGVPRRAVRLVSGPTSRTKVVEVDGADPAVLQRLLGAPDPPIRH